MATSRSLLGLSMLVPKLKTMPCSRATAPMTAARPRQVYHERPPRAHRRRRPARDFVRPHRRLARLARLGRESGDCHKFHGDGYSLNNTVFGIPGSPRRLLGRRNKAAVRVGHEPFPQFAIDGPAMLEDMLFLLSEPSRAE